MIGYTGHEMLWAQGLVYTWARLYSPAIGRWLSPDPTVPNMYNGQSLNRYSYVLNNPLSLWDPWGLKEDPTISPPIQVVCPDGGPGSGCLCPIGMRPVPTGHAPGAYDCASSGPGGISPVGGGGGGPGGANGAGGFGRPGNNNNNSNQNKKNGCGSSKGIPAGEGLTPATPPVQILKPGSNQTQVTATNASQLQVALVIPPESSGIQK